MRTNAPRAFHNLVLFIWALEQLLIATRVNMALQSDSLGGVPGKPTLGKLGSTHSMELLRVK